MTLNLMPNFEDPDAVYQMIVDAHRAFDAPQSAAFNARLVLILANHIGDENIIASALESAGTEADES